MTYMQDNGRDLDMVRFTTDLAAALGSTANVGDKDHMGGNIELDGDALPDCPIHGALKLTVWRGQGYANREKVVLRLYPNDIPHEYAAGAYGSSDTMLPDIMVSTSRPMVQIVNEIKRRLIPQAVEPIANRRKRAASAKDYENRVQSAAECIRAVAKRLQVKDGQNGGDPTIYVNIDGSYLSGRIQGSGVTIDRCSLSLDDFLKVVRALDL